MVSKGEDVMSRPIIALMYDFDKTLCPRDMQEFSFIPSLGMDSGAFWDFSKQNVFFTLFLGYLGICAYEGLRNKWFLRAGTIVVLLLGSILLRADYGLTGFCFILLMYALRDHELLRDAIGTGALTSQWKAGLAFVPLALYNGKRGFIKGPVLKYAFYLVYPLHLLALYCIKHYVL